MTIAFSDEESALLDKIAIDMALDALPPFERDLIRCQYTYGDPPGGDHRWPRTYEEIGRRLGQLHARPPLSGPSICKYSTRIHAAWAHINRSRMANPFIAVRTKYTPTITALATAIGKRDPDLIQDLQQEGDLALWRAGPERWPKFWYCQTIIRSAMLDHWRRERRHARPTRKIPLSR